MTTTSSTQLQAYHYERDRTYAELKRAEQGIRRPGQVWEVQRLNDDLQQWDHRIAVAVRSDREERCR